MNRSRLGEYTGNGYRALGPETSMAAIRSCCCTKLTSSSRTLGGIVKQESRGQRLELEAFIELEEIFQSIGCDISIRAWALDAGARSGKMGEIAIFGVATARGDWPFSSEGVTSRARAAHVRGCRIFCQRMNWDFNQNRIEIGSKGGSMLPT